MRFGYYARELDRPYDAMTDSGRTPVQFDEFEIRAWRADAQHLDVLVHASPAGSMSRPSRVAFSRAAQARTQIDARAPLSAAFDTGRTLARALLPSPVRFGRAAQGRQSGLRSSRAIRVQHRP